MLLQQLGRCYSIGILDQTFRHAERLDLAIEPKGSLDPLLRVESRPVVDDLHVSPSLYNDVFHLARAERFSVLRPHAGAGASVIRDHANSLP